VNPSSPAGERSARASEPLQDSAALIAERRAEATAPGPAFARGLWRIAAADVSSGNKVELLHDGPHTFDVMIADIDAAVHSVSLESYILRSDEIGHRFADALTRAVARGVTVRLLTDWIGMRGIRKSFVTGLRK
jgi:phosphatidylserine/phosphatidylglycerophosphate/cardiolipin synthase-like enzyme